MEDTIKRITRITHEAIRTVTFVYGDMRIIYRASIIAADSIMFVKLFGDVSDTNFELDLDKIKNIEPPIYVKYLDALSGNYNLTENEEYDLLTWTESKMITSVIIARIKNLYKLDVLSDAQRDSIIKFIYFINDHMNNINGYERTFVSCLICIAAKPLITWQDLEKQPVEICLFMLELYSIYNHARRDKDEPHNRIRHANKIFGEKFDIGDTRKIIALHYGLLLGYTYKTMPPNGDGFDFEAKFLVRAPSLNIFRAHVLAMK
jgi:hypothetical protein